MNAPGRSAVPVARDIHFYSSGFRLAGSHFSGADHAAGLPCVVLCQGNTGVRKYARFDELGARLAASGFEVISFDYRGFGESEGPRGRFFPADLVQDARSAITAVLDKRPDRPVGLFGAGVGGTIAAAAATDERVHALVTLVTPFDCGRWIRGLHRYWEWQVLMDRIKKDRSDRLASGHSTLVEMDDIMPPSPKVLERRHTVPGRPSPRGGEHQLTLESVEHLLELRPETDTARKAGLSILIIHAADSEIVPVDEAHSMWSAHLGPKRLVVFQNAAHHDVFGGSLFDRVTDEAASWFTEHLGKTTPS